MNKIDRKYPEILVFSSLFPNRYQTTHGMFVAELCDALSDFFNVNVVAPVNGLRYAIGILKNTFAAQKVCPTFPIYRPPFFTVPFLFKDLDARLMAFWCQTSFRHVLQKEIKLVHAHYAYPEAVAAAQLSCSFKLPFIITTHGSDINVIAQDSRRRNQIAWVLQQADAVVTVSRELSEKIKCLAGVDVNTVHIPNGVNLKKFSTGDRIEARRERGLLPNVYYLLTVGRLEPVKAYDRLIHALSLLPSNIHLILVGDGSMKNRLVELSRQLGLSWRVSFSGSVSHNELAPYYRAADFLVISSHSEGWPTVIYESLACGTPVLAHAVGGIPEILTDKKVGMLISDNNPEILAQHIDQAISSHWNRSRAEEIARRHSWHHIAEQHAALYMDIINNHK